MAPQISYAKATLNYPLYSAAFDPYNRGYLLVGGGGGEGRSGVPNKITLLDVSSRSAIEEVGEIDLPRTEDSVNTLANLGTSAGVIALAGINSSTEDCKRGQNEHFRTYSVVYPEPKTGKGSKKNANGAQDEKQTPGKIEPLSKCRVFSTQKDDRARVDAYQRILRLSPATIKPGKHHGNKRIGAIATGLAKESELVVFNGTVTRPDEKDIIRRITPPKAAEVIDMDIAEPDDGYFLLTYATDGEVFLGEIAYDFTKRKAKGKLSDPHKIFSMPFPDVFESPTGRSKFRFVRFLTADHLLLLQNHITSNGKVCELVIMKVYPSGGPGDILLRKRFSKRLGPSVGMDVCALDADETTGARQFAVAVAGQDRSIVVLTVDYSGKKTDQFGPFRTVTTIKDVHAHTITKVVFSPFIPPAKYTAASSKPFLFLASTSISHTVSVEHIPLTTTTTSTDTPRHLLSPPQSALTALSAISSPLIYLAAFLLVSTIVLQSFFDYRTATSNSPAVQLIPNAIRQPLSHLRDAFSQMNAARQQPTPKLRELRQRVLPAKPHSTPLEPGKAVLVTAPETEGMGGKLLAELHHDEAVLHADPGARRWEELSKREQESWKGRLVRAGEWAVEEGETVLKGVFFSGLAGFVGEAARE
ncbi:hypothetical protein P152DRAFT_423210, partial [Eremomyces bilateralis CBS 781.70]